MTQTKRDYLASKGLAIAGARGKFSNAAKAELERVRGEGMRFSDDETTAVAPVKPRTAPVAREVPTMVDYLYPSDFRFPESEYKAVTAAGKVHSMRECCNTCRVSLTNHGCNTPTIHDNVAVTIVGR